MVNLRISNETIVYQEEAVCQTVDLSSYRYKQQ